MGHLELEYGTSMQDLHDKTQSLYQNIGSHLVLCLFRVRKNPRHRLRFVNDSCIAWVTSILHFQRIRTKNHLPAEHGIRKHLQEISRRLDDDMTLYSYHTRNWQSPHFRLPLHMMCLDMLVQEPFCFHGRQMRPPSGNSTGTKTKGQVQMVKSPHSLKQCEVTK